MIIGIVIPLPGNLWEVKVYNGDGKLGGEHPDMHDIEGCSPKVGGK